MSGTHIVTAEGESTEKWAMRAPGFVGSVKQLIACGRCGEYLQGGQHTKHHFGNLFKTDFYWLCDECYVALPE